MGAEMGVQNTCMEMAAEMTGILPGKNIGRGPLGTNGNPASDSLLVYFQEMLATQTLDRTVPLDAGSHLFYFHNCLFIFQ